MTIAKPNILYLVHRVPYPPNRGDRIRSFHILKYLAERADVSLATLADESVEPGTEEALGKFCQRFVINHLGRARWVRAVASLAAGRSATEGLFRSSKLRDSIAQWAKEIPFDAVVVFCSSMVQYLDLPELAGIPVIVDLVDVDSQKFLDYASHKRGVARRLYRLEAGRLRRVECSLPSRAKAITLVSEAEAELYRDICPNDQTVAVPNGVDLDYFRPTNDGSRPWTPLPELRRSDLVFVGALDYQANIDGVIWFVREVWPLVQNAMPNLTLGLVGRNPAPSIQKLSQTRGICVIGTVPDIRPYLAAANIAIAPLRIARGIQNKVLEAMAMGKPVIASPAAHEGLEAAPGQDLIIAAHPDEWLNCIERLMSDGSLCSDLSVAARRKIENCYGWSAALEPLARLIDGRLSVMPSRQYCPEAA